MHDKFYLKYAKNALHAISPHLKFTFERHDEFPEGWIPTLDFQVKQDFQRNSYTHKFYEKTMQSKFIIPKKSAIEMSSKCQILANELCRRLSRNDPSIPLEDFNVETINQFTKKMAFSGYSFEETLRITDHGITLYMRRMENSKKDPRSMYKHSFQTVGKRNRKKLTEKTTWYKGWSKTAEADGGDGGGCPAGGS